MSCHDADGDAAKVPAAVGSCTSFDLGVSSKGHDAPRCGGRKMAKGAACSLQVLSPMASHIMQRRKLKPWGAGNPRCATSDP